MNVYHVHGSWDDCRDAGHYGGLRILAQSPKEAALAFMRARDYRNAFVVSHGPIELGMTYTYKDQSCR